MLSAEAVKSSTTLYFVKLRHVSGIIQALDPIRMISRVLTLALLQVHCLVQKSSIAPSPPSSVSRFDRDSKIHLKTTT